MSRLATSGAWAVHALTASGVVFAALAAAEIASAEPRPRVVFAWLMVTVLVDAIDGPFARKLQVKKWLPHIDGRTIDDIVDYLTFTFLPLLLVWKMGWVPAPGIVWVGPAMAASLIGFANTGAKQEGEGFFLGFPSYWNIYAFYAGLWAARGPTLLAGLLAWLLAALTLAPVRFIYPNLAPRGWRGTVLGGAAVWWITLIALLPEYPYAPAWLLALSFAYPAFYCALSLHLDLAARRRQVP